MTVQPNAESLAVAARAIAECMEEGGPWVNYEQMHKAQAQAAITAFLSAERARGVELRPREATDAMGMAGYVCALPVFEGERCEPNPHDWQKCWTAMWDAGAQK